MFDDHLQRVLLAVVHPLVAEHGRPGVVADVVAHPDPPPEHLHGHVLVGAGVHDDASVGVGGEDDGDVDRVSEVNSLQLDV